MHKHFIKNLYWIFAILLFCVLYTNPCIGNQLNNKEEDNAIFHFVGDDGLTWPQDQSFKTYYEIELGCELKSNVYGLQTYSVNWINLIIDLFYNVNVKDVPPLSEHYKLIFNSEDFNLSFTDSYVQYVEKGALVNPIDDNFFAIHSKSKKKEFITPVGSIISFDSSELFLGTLDANYNYCEAGYFWGVMSLPPLYIKKGWPRIQFGEFLLQDTPSTVKFLDVENQERKVIGSSADGESQVIIEVTEAKTKPEITVPEDGGELISDFENVGDNTWQATWLAPENSVVDCKFELLDFVFIVNGKTIKSPLFYIFKTPVLMLHGIWSSGYLWKTMEKDLVANNFAYYFMPSYPNSESYDENAWVLNKYMRDLKGLIKQNGFVVNKVDIVAHSMGGVLTKRPIYHSEKDIRTITTIGTPHYCSPLADLLWTIYTNVPAFVQYSMNYWLRKFMPSGNPCGPPTIDGGAIEDLRVDGGIPVAGNAIDVPSLTACGISVNKNILPDWFQFIVTILSFYYSDFGIILVPDKVHDYLFKDDSSDWVVSYKSQRGGMTSNFLDIIFHSYEIGHLLEAEDPTFISKTIEFLNSHELSKNETYLGLEKLKKSSPIFGNMRKNPSININNSKTSNNEFQVKISSPIEGMEFQPGDSVHVTVEAENADFIFILGGWVEWTVDSLPPYNLNFHVPEEIIGEFEIVAFGNDKQGNIGSDIAKINIVSYSNIEYIECWPSNPAGCYAGDSLMLDIYGQFKDGIERCITPGMLGTSYSSSNPDIAIVNGNGIVKAISPGTTTITIENQVSTQLIFYVFGSPGFVSHPNPADGMTNVPPSTDLDWWGSDFASTYNLFLWESSEVKPSSPNVVDLKESFYDLPSDLKSSTAYKWQVIAKNYSGQTKGAEWNFITAGNGPGMRIAVSPNPFVPPRGHQIISFFGEGLQDAEIKIFNKAGELVKTLKADDRAYRMDWIPKNENGEDLASGVYIYVLKEKSGKVSKDKFAIIR